MITLKSKRLAVLVCWALVSCAPQPARNDDNIAHDYVGSVSSFESGEVIVLVPLEIPPPPEGESWTDVIVGEGGNDRWFDNLAGRLADDLFVCSGGFPVWLRTYNDAPTYVVTPSTANLNEASPDTLDSNNDTKIVECVKRSYSGPFDAGIAKSGMELSGYSKVPFKSLYAPSTSEDR